MALVSELDHFNISTGRLAETVAFFEERSLAAASR